MPLDGPIRWPGYSAEVDGPTFDALKALGAVEVVEAPAEASAAVEDEPAEAPVEVESTDEPDEVEEAPEGMERPKKVANLETWQTYARSMGIDPKGMTKAEIIAATK